MALNCSASAFSWPKSRNRFPLPRTTSRFQFSSCGLPGPFRHSNFENPRQGHASASLCRRDGPRRSVRLSSNPGPPVRRFDTVFTAMGTV
jgi:hypothetical protein